MHSKQEVREYVWKKIEPFSTFPPPYGRIPNFTGADKACEKLRSLKEYRKADTIFCAPDSPLRRAREVALEDGKTLIVAKPHLKGFLKLRGKLKATIKEMLRRGTEVKLKEIDTVDVFIQGCVAIDKKGNRIGKGSGYGDREYSILKGEGLLADDCIYVVVAHPVQIFDDLSHLVEEHDIKADVILTPDEIIYAKA